jgi:hypothetical protein
MQTYIVKHRGIFYTLILLAVASCASVPPGRINTARMDYGQVIAESWKRQTLLNVVRLRYADAPVFLDVASVINSYSLAGKASASASLPSSTDPNVFGLGAESTWSNTPTVTYQPLMGDRFTRSLLQPIPPVAVFQMLQGGWPAELVLRTVVGSMNGLRNNSIGRVSDPGFDQLVEAFSRIQRSGGLAFRVEPRPDGNAIIIVLRHGDTDPRLSDDSRRVRGLLGLEEGIDEIEINYGLIARNRREVAVLSRSMLELFRELGFGIELPMIHLTVGRVIPGPQQAGDKPYRALMRIYSGSDAPADTYTTVRYKDNWYWIDDNDVASKSVFTFLLILSSLAETGQSVAAPVVTVPSR